MRSTEKLYFLHKVPVLTVYVGQACSVIFSQCWGAALWIWDMVGLGYWARLITVTGVGQATNGLVLCSEAGVISTAPRDHWECASAQASRSELHLCVCGAWPSWWNKENCVGGWWIRDRINNCKVLLGCYDERHVRSIKAVSVLTTSSSCIWWGWLVWGVLCVLFQGK